MHLRDRARGERLRVEGTEKLGHGMAQLRFDGRLPHARSVGRHSSLKFRELFGDVVAHDIWTQAQHLAELDESRTELSQGITQALTVGGLGRCGRDEAVDKALEGYCRLKPLPACRP